MSEITFIRCDFCFKQELCEETLYPGSEWIFDVKVMPGHGRVVLADFCKPSCKEKYANQVGIVLVE